MKIAEEKFYMTFLSMKEKGPTKSSKFLISDLTDVTFLSQNTLLDKLMLFRCEQISLPIKAANSNTTLKLFFFQEQKRLSQLFNKSINSSPVLVPGKVFIFAEKSA